VTLHIRAEATHMVKVLAHLSNMQNQTRKKLECKLV
jgi:hypothetical protein